MQLKPEFDTFAFENVFSMSGMPEQNIGYSDYSQQDADDHGLEGHRSYLGFEERATSLKRGTDDDHDTTNKRAKSDFSSGFQQSGVGHFSQSTGDNLFNVELQRAQAFAAQQQMDFNAMNSSFGGAGIGLMERRLEEETSRQQQQSAMLANEMALMRQAQMNSNNPANFPSADFNSFASTSNNFGGAGSSSQRQHMFDTNADFFSSSNSLGQATQDFQNLSQLSTMSAQPFLSNMLDLSRLNNRLTQQGLGSIHGGTLPSLSGSNSWNPSLNQVGASQGNSQLHAGLASPSAPSADPTSSLGAFDALQMSSRMNNAGAPSASQVQQENSIVPQQQPSSRASAMMFAQPVGRAPDSRMSLALPPLEEANTPHYSQRQYMPFSIDEDPNWLSEFQCFIRSEILELFRVSTQGIKVRNALKSLTVNQVGIRCRFCAHLQHGTRANRASCFPSKIDKIYQSFTMMLREHFPSCSEIPEAQKQRFMQLQNMNAQGASNAKGYWEHAAKKKGLVDVNEDNGRGGIHIFEHSKVNAALIPPFGADANFHEPQSPVSLVHKSDKGLVSNFLFALMDQTYRVHLAPSERKGNRKSLRPGMPGFGCKYCYQTGRMGLCRLFPARRRTIHTKIPDLFDHMKRCPLCPQQVKDNLIFLHNQDGGGVVGSSEQDQSSRGREREFFERVWARLGHQEDAE